MAHDPFSSSFSSSSSSPHLLGIYLLTVSQVEVADEYDIAAHFDAAAAPRLPQVSLLDRRLARLSSLSKPSLLLHPPEHDLAQHRIRALQAEVNQLKAYWTTGVYGADRGPGNRDEGLAMFESPAERAASMNLPWALIELRRQFWALFECQINSFTERNGWAVPGWDVVGLDESKLLSLSLSLSLSFFLFFYFRARFEYLEFSLLISILSAVMTEMQQMRARLDDEAARHGQ